MNSVEPRNHASIGWACFAPRLRQHRLLHRDKTNRRILALKFTSVCVLLLASCSAPPSTGEAEAYWQNLIRNSNGLIRFISFSKTDGKSTPDGYTLYYAVTYEFVDDCQFDSSFHAQRGMPQGLDAIGSFGLGHSVGKKGDQVVLRGAMRYEKRERGWTLIAAENSGSSFSQETLEHRRIAEESRQQELARSKIETREISTFALMPQYNDGPDRAVITDVSVKLHFPNGPRTGESMKTVYFADLSRISDLFTQFSSGRWSVQLESSALVDNHNASGRTNLECVNQASALRLRIELLANWQSWRTTFPTLVRNGQGH